MATTVDATAWETRSEQLTFSGDALIGNKSTPARSGETFEKRSPVDGRLLAEVASCDTADVDDAVRAARKAFEAGVWSGLAPRERKRILLDYAARILDASHCQGLLRSTYVDETGTYLVTVGVAAFPGAKTKMMETDSGLNESLETIFGVASYDTDRRAPADTVEHLGAFDHGAEAQRLVNPLTFRPHSAPAARTRRRAPGSRSSACGSARR